MWRRLRFILQVKKSIPFALAFFRSPQVSLLKKCGIALLFAAYFLLPFDLFPDFFPLIGYVDELTLLGFILNYIVKEAPGELRKQFKLE